MPHLRVVPLALKQANEAVLRFHRHHKPVVGHRFSIGAMDGDRLVGALIAGRPVARCTDQQNILEVSRLATDGTRNACSILYAAAARAADALGFQSIQTFILETEPGTSLKASGWRMDGVTNGGEWTGTPSRGERQHAHPTCVKQRWVKDLANKPKASEPQPHLVYSPGQILGL